MANSRILILSDLHFPYNHPDTVAFLRALKSKYRPDRVISVGDEVDYHAISFHSHDPDLLSPSDELKTAINRLRPIYKLFPKMDIVESNHGSLVYRKGKANGLPRHVFKSYRETLEAPTGWKWHFDLTITMSNGQKLYVCHGKSGKPLALSQTMGMCAVQGHFHEKYGVNYWANSEGLYWDMHIGCLIDDDSLAFAYNNTNLKRPIIGCAVVIEGHPKLCPMLLDSKGRWTGKLT